MEPGYLLLIPLAVAAYCFARLFSAWMAVDRFVKALYRDHKHIWIKIGKPNGYRWNPQGHYVFPTSMFYFQNTWFRNDPEWLTSVPELRVDFEAMRSGFRFWNRRAVPLMISLWIGFGLLVVYLRQGWG